MVAQVIAGLKYAVTVCSALAVLENLLVIAVIAGNRSRRVRYYGLVFNLAVADLFFSAFSTAFPWTEYHIIYCLFMTGYVASVLTTLAVALNRYLALAVTPPARYDALVRGRHLFGLCLLIWCFSILMNLLPIMTSSQEVTLLIYGLFRPLTVFLSWLITTILYFVVCCKINKRIPPDPSNPGFQASAETGQTKAKFRQIALSVILILGVSLVCWMPYSVVRIVAFVDPSHFFNHNLDIAYWFTGSFYCISAMVNPLIYWVRSDGFIEGVYTRLEDSKEIEEAENEETVVDVDV